MSRRTTGILILLVVSEVAGVLVGNWFFGIFDKTVPPAMATDFNRAAARAYFLIRGALFGFILFLWSLAVLLVARFFRPPKEELTPPLSPPAA